MKIEILPSLLAADFGRLADEILRAEASGAEALHLDIMDAHFVPNLSFGPDVVALAKRTAPGFYRNVHLMMSRPDLYLEKFAAAGAETIQVHVEADCNLHVELKRIRELGLKNAIVLNPETPVERLAPYLDEIDEALVRDWIEHLQIVALALTDDKKENLAGVIYRLTYEMVQAAGIDAEEPGAE